MSAYISIWVRANSGGPYICLDIWSRSTEFFNIMSEMVAYGTFKELAEDMLREGIDDARAQIERYNDMIADEKEAIKFLQSCVQLKGDELLERFFDHKNSIDESQQLIDRLESVIAQCQFFIDMIDEQSYGENTAKFYLSYECDPNYREKENSDGFEI